MVSSIYKTTERERLIKLMETEGLNAKQFAAEVGIQNSTVSNIVNGRNKPSLEVLQKVLDRFRAVSSDWLILDSGNMYRPTGEQTNRTLFDEQPIETAMLPVADEGGDMMPKTAVPDGAVSALVSAPAAKESMPVSLTEEKPAEKTNRKIEKIVVFYSDGTYENFSLLH